MAPIMTRAELERGTRGRAVRSRRIPRPADRVLRLPPPQNGVCYRQAEIAGFLGRRLSTVRDWVAQRDGRQLRLATLRCPRGMVAPADLREFLSLRNPGTRVVIREAARHA